MFYPKTQMAQGEACIQVFEYKIFLRKLHQIKVRLPRLLLR